MFKNLQENVTIIKLCKISVNKVWHNESNCADYTFLF